VRDTSSEIGDATSAMLDRIVQVELSQVSARLAISVIKGQRHLLHQTKCVAQAPIVFMEQRERSVAQLDTSDVPREASR